MASAILPSLRLRPNFSAATSASSSLSSSSAGNFKPRPAVILPGLGNNSGDYKKLEVTLGEYGVPAVIAAVSRLDWFRNAAGLVDAAYWRGTLRPRPVLDWYLNRIDDAVREANELSQGQGLSLIGHSAGGWLARVYMEEYGNSDIALLLTLGTPHLPPPRGQSGVIDQTRGLLYYVEDHCAKAVYTPEMRYVCIAGRYLRGARLVDNADAEVDYDATVGVDSGEAISELAIASNKKSVSSGPSFRARFVGQGYKQVCGRADVWGDGVVPEVSAHLEGALNVSFDGVYHSPVGSDDETRPWYGSPAIVKDWIHNQLSCRFQAHCFMENVKEVCNRYEVRRLQGEFLCRMFRERDKEVWSSVICCSVIKERFRHKRVLIVLDDVDRSEQLNELVKEIDWFGPGSRIIVTTRDRHLLVSHGIDLVYKVKCIPKKEALQLFCNYAFRNESIVPHGFLELSVQAINYASGLPLALRVLGSFLYQRSQREWESTLARLETYPPKDIMEVLRVSYDGLDEQEKAIFLYISCFYNMKHVDYAIKLLDICGYAAEIGITVLTEKSLIVVSNEFVKMHDLLEQMGREIVRQQAVNKPAQRLLLWDPEDICDMLSQNSGTEFVEGISLNLSEISEVFASDRAFEGFSNLKLLNFYDLSFDGETRVHLPNGLSYLPHKLRYLRWDGYPLKTMPSRFHPEFLVELCMSNSNLEKLWDGIQPLRKLKKMDLSCCNYLLEIPDLSKATNLVELNLNYCQSLVEVTPSIKNLQRLCFFYLTNCIQLKNIPTGIVLKSLETLGMSGCSSLVNFPEISWNARRLSEQYKDRGTAIIDQPSLLSG